MTSIVFPRSRTALLDELRLDRGTARHLAMLVATIVAFGATYGAVLGS